MHWQLDALNTAISKARETNIFTTPDRFLFRWLYESLDKQEYSNLFRGDSAEDFRLRLRTGTYIQPMKWLLKGKHKKRLDNYYLHFGINKALDGNPIDAKFLRARMEAIRDLIEQTDKDDPARILLRNGVFPKDINQDKLISEQYPKKDFPSAPLSFVELTSFNTWFNIHPEKMAGKEVITSSREFPITIRGTKADIEKTIRRGFTRARMDFSFSMQLKRKSAKAKLKLLTL